MIRDTGLDQQGLFAPEDFQTPFCAGLDPDNRWVRWVRWVRWARQMPWTELAGVYHRSLKAGGRTARPARRVIGALIIRHRLGLSDVETIEQLQENPYLQYFCGFVRFQHEAAFAPALFVALRKRLTPARFAAFEQAVMDQMVTIERRPREEHSGPSSDNDPPEAPPDGPSGTRASAASHPSYSTGGDTPQTTGQSTLIVDASVAERRIRYPNDVSLLSEAHESAEDLIDGVWDRFKAHRIAITHKSRNYRQRARRDDLAYSKTRQRGGRALRRARRAQL